MSPFLPKFRDIQVIVDSLHLDHAASQSYRLRWTRAGVYLRVFAWDPSYADFNTDVLLTDWSTRKVVTVFSLTLQRNDIITLKYTNAFPCINLVAVNA